MTRPYPKYEQKQDAELLQAIAERDEHALALLYDRYRLILFGLTMRILNSRPEAEDVLQEVLLQVWRRASDFDPLRGKPFTWLVTIARSRAIDRLRQLGARDRLSESAAREAPDEMSDASADALHSEQRQIVKRALAELPEEQRQVLLLAYYDGLTQAEIATKLATPLGTVKTRMRAGMMKLRGLLKDRMKTIQ
jgi:RNA polymerase sigma-70 factor (ECF subfamily)